MTTAGDRRTVRRCHSCGSRLPAGERRCTVCGASVPWYLTPRGVVIESIVAVTAVLLAVGALLWLRGRDVPVPTPEASNVYRAVTALPTPLPTFTTTPTATATFTSTEATEVVGAPDTSPAPVADDSPAATTSVTYTVQSGDNLWAISQELGVALEDILAANPGADQSLSIGQALIIPVTPEAGAVQAEEPTPEATPGTPTSTPEPELYAVQPGDTLAAVAAAHGLGVRDLVAMNEAELDGVDTELRPGQLLRVRSQPGLRDPAAPTPAAPMPFPAPIVLAPADGAIVTNDAPHLRWVSAGLLPNDVFYVVSLRDVDAVDESGEELVWIGTDANTLIVPARFRPAPGASRTIAWTVTVRRASGRSMGEGPGEVLCPAPEPRSLIWSP